MRHTALVAARTGEQTVNAALSELRQGWRCLPTRRGPVLRGERFLPLDRIDDTARRARPPPAPRRAGAAATLCSEGERLALLRRKLAAEPQIHGGKRTRVLFEGGGERTERRPPR